MAEVRAMTNKGLQLISEATGVGVIVFTKAYLSREVLTEEAIFNMTQASGTNSTTTVNTTEGDVGYIVIAEFANPDTQAKTAILCGRLASQTDAEEIPICVYSSSSPIGLSGTSASVTFTLMFSQVQDGVIQPSGGDTMSRGEIIAYINSLFQQQAQNPDSGIVRTTGDQEIRGAKTFKSTVALPSIQAEGENPPMVKFDSVSHRTQITSPTNDDTYDSTNIALNPDSIELNSSSILIPYKGQVRSLQNILSAIQGSNTGSLRHALYLLENVGVSSENVVHVIPTIEKAGDLSLSGTHFLTRGNNLFAVVCIGVASASSVETLSESFMAQTFRVTVTDTYSNGKTTSVNKHSEDAVFRWYDNKQDLLAVWQMSTPDALPCFAEGTQCACATLIPLGNWLEGTQDTHQLEVSVSNAIELEDRLRSIEERLAQLEGS